MLFVIAHSITLYRKAFEKAFKEFRQTSRNPGICCWLLVFLKVSDFDFPSHDQEVSVCAITKF